MFNNYILESLKLSNPKNIYEFEDALDICLNLVGILAMLSGH